MTERDNGPGAAATGGDRQSVSSPARAGQVRHLDNVEDLVFNPDDAWFSDVPLATVDATGALETVRGTLTKRELEQLAAEPWLPHRQVLGVFTNNVGRTTWHAVGDRFPDDPRDRHVLDPARAYDGTSLTEVAARLRQIADWLDEQAARGWVLTSLDEYLVMTDAPDRVPSELTTGPEPPSDWSGGADLGKHT